MRLSAYCPPTVHPTIPHSARSWYDRLIDRCLSSWLPGGPSLNGHTLFASTCFTPTCSVPALRLPAPPPAHIPTMAEAAVVPRLITMSKDEQEQVHMLLQSPSYCSHGQQVVERFCTMPLCLCNISANPYKLHAHTLAYWRA